jgi:formiminotetrahydrofolate cyclodeaminase
MEAFLSELAAATPTPGGGSAGAVAAAMAAALGEMAMGLAARRGKADEADVAAFRALREAFARQAQEDAAAFDAVLAAMRRPKDDPERGAAMALALKGAAEVPLTGLARLVELGRLLNDKADRCPAPAATDYEAAWALWRAAADILAANVAVNLDGAAEAEALRAALAARKDELSQLR